MFCTGVDTAWGVKSAEAVATTVGEAAGEAEGELEGGLEGELVGPLVGVDAGLPPQAASSSEPAESADSLRNLLRSSLVMRSS